LTQITREAQAGVQRPDIVLVRRATYPKFTRGVSVSLSLKGLAASAVDYDDLAAEIAVR
jgi:hypothetical protein